MHYFNEINKCIKHLSIIFFFYYLDPVKVFVERVLNKKGIPSRVTQRVARSRILNCFSIWRQSARRRKRIKAAVDLLSRLSDRLLLRTHFSRLPGNVLYCNLLYHTVKIQNALPCDTLYYRQILYSVILIYTYL